MVRALIMENDPYSTPAASPFDGSGVGGVGPVSVAAVGQLAATRPWVRFMSVTILIGAGFMVLTAVVMGAMSGTLAKSSGSAGNPFGGKMAYALMAFYLVLAVFHVFPGVKLWKYANSITVLLQNGRDEDLVAALNQQRSFWKLTGILVLVLIALYIVGVVVGVVFAGISAAKMR